MKTENTLENKAKFFAQYWGQNIVIENKHHLRWVTDLIFLKYREGGMFSENPMLYKYLGNLTLELTPISQITDEDAKHLAEIENHYDNSLVRGKVLASWMNSEFTEGYSGMVYEFMTAFKMLDYLRSKGYVLPWMDLSIEDLVDYGWIKLKD